MKKLIFIFFLFVFVTTASEKAIFEIFAPHSASAQTSSEWYMAGANPKRTGWNDAETRITSSQAAPKVLWYRKIEAYIDQKVQLIAAQGNIYVSTSRGLVVLNANSGELVWRFDTQLPLGHSPTVVNGVVYVGGFDKKLYAIDANNGSLLWTYEGAKAGYNTNPLVVDGKVILGNRDGAVYSIYAHGLPNQGQLAWKFQTGGPITYSGAYNNGVVYFASNDQHAYAINVSSGSQIWRSEKLISDGFHSYYPVIYKDKVVFTVTKTVGGALELMYGTTGPENEGVLPGTVEPANAWSDGFPVLYPDKILTLLENPENPDTNVNRPWHRKYLVLNQSNGQEFTFDSDGDGASEYAPFILWSTGTGSYSVPIVDPLDEILYSGTVFACCSDAKGKVYGWNSDDPGRLSYVGSRLDSNGRPMPLGGYAAMAEPQAISGAGNTIYRSLCCDRIGDWFAMVSPQQQGQLWSYNLGGQIPGYDSQWGISNRAISRHVGWYKGAFTTDTGVYHSHGDQNPIIPYDGKAFIHRSNAIIAFGDGVPRGELPIINIANKTDSVAPFSNSDLISRLEQEVQKIIDVDGHLRPGFLTTNLHLYHSDFGDYYINPGDTLYTLSLAYPHLSPLLKQQVQGYLQNELVPDYFDPTMYAMMGWSEGSPREWKDLVLEEQNLAPQNKTPNPVEGGWSWQYPPFNFYAMYIYAKNVPGVGISRLYSLATGRLQVPVPTPNPNLYPGGLEELFSQDPFEHNAWISGYVGYLKLGELAGITGDFCNQNPSDSACVRRQNVINEKNRLLSMRYQLFDRESHWNELLRHYKKTLDIARNFMFMTPELGTYFRGEELPGEGNIMPDDMTNKTQDALAFYDYLAPYWFVGKYEAIFGESVFQSLYNQSALFQAKAWVLRQPKEELYKYLDTPMFARGDLIYIQNLVATIEAPSDPSYTPPPSQTPAPVPGDANGDGRVDGVDYVTWLIHYNQTTPNGATDGDFNIDGTVDGVDYVIWLQNYSG